MLTQFESKTKDPLKTQKSKQKNQKNQQQQPTPSGRRTPEMSPFTSPPSFSFSPQPLSLSLSIYFIAGLPFRGWTRLNPTSQFANNQQPPQYQRLLDPTPSTALQRPFPGPLSATKSPPTKKRPRLLLNSPSLFLSPPLLSFQLGGLGFYRFPQT